VLQTFSLNAAWALRLTVNRDTTVFSAESIAPEQIRRGEDILVDHEE
jgi:hypothetical protein